MKTISVISAALAVASFTGVALAGNSVSGISYGAVQSQESKKFSGALSAGYASNYGYRGLIYDNKAGGNNTPIALDLNYDFNDVYSLFGGVGYTAIWDKGDFINENESTLKIGGSAKWVKGLTTSLNYQVTHGGMMGEYLKAERGNAHSVFQSVGAGLRYDFDAVGVKGLFAEVNVDYVFQGNTGWWFEGKIGYKYDITPRFSAVLTGVAEMTAGYYGNASPLGDGAQSLGLKLELPYKVSKYVTVVPFVGTWWLGDGGNNANKVAPQEYRLRNFTVAAGASLVCTF